MNAAHLLILITRIAGRDEWENLWKFPSGDCIAFISPGKVTTLAFEQFLNFDLSTQLTADVWIIRGGDYYEAPRRKIFHQALDNFDWTNRNVILRIHRGRSRFVEDEDFQEQINKIEFENTKKLLKQATNYSIGDIDEPDHPFVRFAATLRPPFNEAEYKEYLEALKAESFLHMRIANTIHHLSYVLHPLDIDFQGLMATGFPLDYWKEVVGDYKGGKALGKLTQTRELIYSKSDGAESVLAEAERRFGNDGPWMSSWEELRKSYLPKDNGPRDIKEILTLMQDDSEENLKEIKTRFSRDKNPIHEWVTNINRTLGEIRDTLSAREKGLISEPEK